MSPFLWKRKARESGYNEHQDEEGSEKGKTRRIAIAGSQPIRRRGQEDPKSVPLGDFVRKDNGAKTGPYNQAELGGSGSRNEVDGRGSNESCREAHRSVTGKTGDHR
jgi:hypothetical protein